MEALFEVLLQLFGELLIQLFFEGAAEAGAHTLGRRDGTKPVNAFLAAVGYVVIGVIFGLASLGIFPNGFITNPTVRVLNLVLAPLLAGGIMMLAGKWRRQRNQELVRLDRFGYAFLFALAMAVVRYLGVK
jgi:cytochrome bd-type quinol oxidase subunit 2